VLSTALDAHARDFYLRVVSDGSATTDDASHEAALRIMARTQPNVVVTAGEAEKLFA
jgi:nicotinamidase-related amidase